MKYLYSYNKFSEGAKLLAETMGIKRIRHNGSRYRYKRGNEIINWGSSTLPDFGNTPIINTPRAVSLASNKLKFFTTVSQGDDQPVVPEWTTDKTIVREFLDAGKTVCARQKLQGHSAEGLVLLVAGDDIIDAPLYTVYKKKRDEYRVHVHNGRVIDVQKKMKRRGFEGERDQRIRNLANGYIYGRENIDPPECVLEQAVKSVNKLGLVFGACDIIYNEYEQMAYSLEVNSAPGLSGSTLLSYAEALRM